MLSGVLFACFQTGGGYTGLSVIELSVIELDEQLLAFATAEDFHLTNASGLVRNTQQCLKLSCQTFDILCQE